MRSGEFFEKCVTDLSVTAGNKAKQLHHVRCSISDPAEICLFMMLFTSQEVSWMAFPRGRLDTCRTYRISTWTQRQFEKNLGEGGRGCLGRSRGRSALPTAPNYSGRSVSNYASQGLLKERISFLILC